MATNKCLAVLPSSRWLVRPAVLLALVVIYASTGSFAESIADNKGAARPVRASQAQDLALGTGPENLFGAPRTNDTVKEERLQHQVAPKLGTASSASDDQNDQASGSWLKPQTSLARLIYDDRYIASLIDEHYPYLRRDNGTYLGLRDYFDFDEVFWPSRDYLEARNIEQVVYEEMRAFELTAGWPDLDPYVYSEERGLRESGGAARDEARCRSSMARLESELEAAARDPHRLFAPGTRNMELLRWIDAWGRPVSETYLGSNVWKGSYRACKGVALDLSGPAGGNGSASSSSSSSSSSSDEVGGVHGAGGAASSKFNYCWAKLAPRDFPANDVMRPPMSFKVGVCLPEACDTLGARAMLPRILKMAHFNFAPMHRERFTRILDIYCLPVRQPEASSATATDSAGEVASTAGDTLDSLLPIVGDLPTRESRLFALATLAWLLLIAYCSLRHVCGGGGGSTGGTGDDASWTSMLSFQRNYRALAADDAPPASNTRLDLRALGLPRLFASLLVVVGHCFIHSYYGPVTPRFHLEVARQLRWFPLSLTWKSVDIFYALTGLLTAYTLMCKFAPKRQLDALIKPQVYLGLQLMRLLRVAPLMWFIWAFMRTSFVHFGGGPFWDYGTNKHTFMGQCQRISWWRWLIWPVILDFKGHTGDPYQHECLAVSWSVFTELKMFLAVPFYLYALNKWPRARWPLLGAVLAVSTAWRCAHLHLQQLVHMRQIFSYGEMHALHIFITKLDSAYYSPIDRFQSLALGLTGGLFLYEYKLGNKLKRWPVWMRSKLSTLLLLAWLVYDATHRLLDEIHFRNTGEIPSDAYTAFWLVMRPRFDAAVATFLMLRLCTDWAPAVMRHSVVLYKLSKVSYCLFAIHSPVIQWAVSGHEHARPNSEPVYLLMLVCFVVSITFLIAFPLYLLVESPVAALVNHFFMGRRQPGASKASSSRHHGKAAPSVKGDTKAGATDGEQVVDKKRV